MLTCRDASFLMSEALDRPLASGQQLSLRLHLLTCRGCRQYRRQMDFLRQACRHYGQEQGGPKEPA